MITPQALRHGRERAIGFAWPYREGTLRARRWAEVPYGCWTREDGSHVLFNRRYRPIWQRDCAGAVSRAEPTEWVPFIAQSWFYAGADTETEKWAKGCAVLLSWGLPLPAGAERAV